MKPGSFCCLLFLHWPVELHERDAGFGEEFFGESIGVVAAVDDAFYADADEDAGAEAAWAVGAVEGGAGRGRSSGPCRRARRCSRW